MSSNDTPLILKEITFRYRDRNEPAIENISLNVKPGEMLLIAGASGCGKTTLIRCINGLIPRSYKGDLSGQVILHGDDASKFSLARISQSIGTVLQDPERQILGTKVLNEVAFGLENLGLSRPEIIERVDQALAYLDISHLRDRETFNLSGGEKQKVALSGVLAMRPGILLLDEPLASLDPASAQDTLSIVRRMVDEGMTVLIIEHRVEDVLKISPDRAMFMDQGKIRYLGSTEGLIKSVDYHEIKLPAPMIIEKAKTEPRPIDIHFTPVESDLEDDVLVQFQDVSFSYDQEVDVLKQINLDIKRGDVIAVLGSNGAGKTTLVKHAIGLLKPNSGRVLVNGRDTNDLSIAQIANTLGYVFQSPSHMLFAPTVHEELSFGPKNLGHQPDEIEKEVNESIQIVNLQGMEKDPPLALSFGQQKRVSIAAILAMQSRIMVMDEPTAGQDYQNYMSFMDSIIELPNFEAILFITHDIDLAVIYANRVLLVNQGQIIADGPPKEVLNDLGRLIDSSLIPTSLLHTNLNMLPYTGRFIRAEALAHYKTI